MNTALLEPAPLVHIRDSLPAAPAAASSDFCSCCEPFAGPPPVPSLSSDSGLAVDPDSIESIDPLTGEILRFKRRFGSSSFDRLSAPADQVARRWQHLAVVRQLLRPVQNAQGKSHRVCACHYAPLEKADSVGVWKKRGAKRAHFRDLMTCGNVWLCSVCGSLISERRRLELQQAITQWQAEGGTVWLCTYTFSHGKWDNLKKTFKALSKARKLMKGGRQYDSIRADFGIEGTVLAAEITHGDLHGWHPHYHELFFLKGGSLDMEQFRRRMYAKWRAACVRAGLGEPSERHGFDVRGGEHAAAYVSKFGEDCPEAVPASSWGMDQEMTKGHIKSGRNGNRSPRQLLDCIADPYATPEQVQEARKLWLDYAAATKGRKQLFWSPGLKERFGIVELEDEEVAAEVQEGAEELARISLEDWVVIRRHSLQYSALSLVEESGQAGLQELLALFRAAPVRSLSENFKVKGVDTS